jgi:shikimate dehydrogenase
VIGFPIRHSLSPVFQQAAFDFHGIAAQYEAWETPPEMLVAAVERLRRPDHLGANVTVPHKQAVMAMLDDVHPLARRIGAVNTIVNQDGRLVGYNTDAAGFLQGLEREAGYGVADKRALVVGAGGAARAVAFALLEGGVADLAIANRRPERAAALASDLQAQGSPVAIESLGTGFDDLSMAVAKADLLVNATSVGMRHTAEEGASPVPPPLLRRDLFVYDLVYNPPETVLLRAAAAIGAPALNGLPMLIYQGAEAFTLWTGRQAPIGLMFERAKEAMQRHG